MTYDTEYHQVEIAKCYYFDFIADYLDIWKTYFYQNLQPDILLENLSHVFLQYFVWIVMFFSKILNFIVDIC